MKLLILLIAALVVGCSSTRYRNVGPIMYKAGKRKPYVRR